MHCKSASIFAQKKNSIFFEIVQEERKIALLHALEVQVRNSSFAKEESIFHRDIGISH